MIKLVVFDWNGTLLADAVACKDADNIVIQAFGGTPIDLKTYRSTIIIPSLDFYVGHGCDRDEILANREKLGHIFHSNYEPRVDKVRTRRNAKALLTWLAGQGIGTAVLSNHTQEGIERQFKRLGLQDLIGSLLANSVKNSSFFKRNKLEKFIDYVEQLGLDFSQVMFVGDSMEEIEIARHAGSVSVAITDGYYATDRLKAAKPDYLVNNLAEIKRIIASK